MFKIVVTSQYGTLSRERHSARKGAGSYAQWAKKDERGNLIINEEGSWMLHCTDGFNRVARATLKVQKNGDWTMTGDTKRFDVI